MSGIFGGFYHPLTKVIVHSTNYKFCIIYNLMVVNNLLFLILVNNYIAGFQLVHAISYGRTVL